MARRSSRLSVPRPVPEGGHHLVVGEVLVVVLVDGVSTGLGVGPPGVLVAVEAQLQVLGEGHGPRLVGQRHHRRHLGDREEPFTSGFLLFFLLRH